MRILTLGGKMLSQCLRDHGHEVVALVPPGIAYHPQDRETDFFSAPEKARETVRSLAASFQPDWILQVDDSSPLPHLGLEDLPFPKAWYAVDSHLHREWHRHYAALFDIVLCAQRNQVAALEEFRAEGPGHGPEPAGASGRRKVEWLPLWFVGEPEFPPWADRAHDVSFVGTLDAALNPARIALLDGLKALGQPIHVARGECGPIYRASRLVLNQSARDDLNFRFFEAMGHGALLITDRLSHSLDAIGEPGRDFLVYEPGDAEDLRAKIHWALTHAETAEAMARRAQAKVLADHTLPKRVRRLLEVLAAPVPAAAPAGPSAPGLLQRGHRLGHLAAAQEFISRLSLPAPLTDFFAAEARRQAMAALEAVPGEPSACLALAQLDLEAGEYARALDCLDAGGGGGSAGPEYHRRYLFLRAVLLGHLGRLPQARAAAESALRAFPGDGDLVRLAAALGLAPDR